MRGSTRDADAGAIVVGAGVIGLAAAIRLLERGWRVQVVSAEPPDRTTSATAAAIWYPYRAYPPERVAAWGRRGYEVLAHHATTPGSSVRMMEGVELLRSPTPWPDWGDAVPGLRRLGVMELPPGIADGFACIAPVARMDRYLPWLAERVRALGGAFDGRRLTSLADVVAGASLVVNCAGLGARALVPDETVYPIRGQVVRVENPGLERWTLDEGHPDGMIYIIPRGDDCILGGTADAGDWSLDPDPGIADAIRRRCASVEPRLATVRVLEHKVGLRPARSMIRLERDAIEGCSVVHCYGHGGAGVTLAWGCADDVADLAGEPPRR